MRILPVFLVLFLTSCLTTTIEKSGGIVVEVGLVDNTVSDEDFEDVIEVISNRIDNSYGDIAIVTPLNDKKVIEVKIPLLKADELNSALLTKNGEFSILETFENSELQELLLEMNTQLYEHIQQNSGEFDMLENGSEFPLFTVLIPNIDGNNNAFPGSKIGMCSGADKEKIDQYLEIESVKALIPENCIFLYSNYSTEGYYEMHAIKKPVNYEYVSQKMIESTRVMFDEYSVSPYITIDLKTEYSELWAEQTRNNIHKNLAIVINNEVYSAPRVQSEITGGSMQISGSFTIEEASGLASLLGNGYLPVTTKINSINYFAPGAYKSTQE